MTPYILIVVVLIVLAVVMAGSKHKGSTPSSPEKPTGTPLPDLHFGAGQESVRTFADTGRTDFGPYSRHVLRFTLTLIDYIASNPPGGQHGIVMDRCSLAALPSGQYRGLGFIFGDNWASGELTGKPAHVEPMRSRTVMELWQVGAEPQGFRYAPAETMGPQLQDGVPVECVLETVCEGGRWHVQYSVDGFTSPIVTHESLNIDPREQAVAFALMGAGRASITKISSEWSGALPLVQLEQA